MTSGLGGVEAQCCGVRKVSKKEKRALLQSKNTTVEGINAEP